LSGGSSDLNVVKLARLLLLVGKGTALICYMANLATAETAPFFGEVGLVLRGEFRRARGGVSAVVGAVAEACQVVDLGAEIVDSDMEVVNVHCAGVGFGGAGGYGRGFREEDGVDQACLMNGLIQIAGLTKLNLLAGVGL